MRLRRSNRGWGGVGWREGEGGAFSSSSETRFMRSPYGKKKCTWSFFAFPCNDFELLLFPPLLDCSFSLLFVISSSELTADLLAVRSALSFFFFYIPSTTYLVLCFQALALFFFFPFPSRIVTVAVFFFFGSFLFILSFFYRVRLGSTLCPSVSGYIRCWFSFCLLLLPSY